MLPLISVWKREKREGLVCRGTPGNPVPAAKGWRGGKSVLIKLKVQTARLRELPQPAGKSDKHPALNQLGGCSLYLWQVGTGRGIAVLREDVVLWLNRDTSSQHLPFNRSVLHPPRESTDKMLPARVWRGVCFHLFCNP